MGVAEEITGHGNRTHGYARHDEERRRGPPLPFPSVRRSALSVLSIGEHQVQPDRNDGTQDIRGLFPEGVIDPVDQDRSYERVVDGSDPPIGPTSLFCQGEGRPKGRESGEDVEHSVHRIHLPQKGALRNAAEYRI